MPAESSSNSGLARQLLLHWRFKLLLYAALTAAFCIPYFLLQRFPLLPPGRFPLTLVDRWVGFHPGWVWVYQSAYLLIPIAPLLSRTRQELKLYARGFLIMTVLAVGFYILMPIEGPRPPDAPREGLYGMLLSYDLTTNTFPSLHVGLIVHSVIFGWWRTADRRAVRMRAAFALAALWIALICYSTLATKQHYAIDIPAGILLGWSSHLWATRAVRNGSVITNPALHVRTQ